MSPNPDAFLDHLRTHGYHPRSDRHSNALAEVITTDLLNHCPKMRDKAGSGGLVYDLNFTLRAGTADWNVDLVLGEPQLGEPGARDEAVIRKESPSLVQVAIELKAVMTEHRKAVKNRKRDLEAHHEHVHNYNSSTIAGGVLIVNASSIFKSPLRTEPTVHKSPMKLVEHCVSELRSVAVRGGRTGYGLEARCAIVVEVDNVAHGAAEFINRSPAPTVGDPLHYDTFIRTICDHYTRRF
ncbi:MAG: hypothetical protein JXQ73_11165 [Phycisphaerae bacterium]|nr:hypothetical protein [Phycisphaerae bacterium]